MKLVKLNAINSTNTYLKELAKETGTSNWTVVSAEFQTSGRGQVQTKWMSDKGKNLIFSVLIEFKALKIKNQFYLNCAISLGVFEALKKYNLPQLMIKWPNDIMAVNKKIGGILIENSLKSDSIYKTVVGIGLNINQELFSKELPKAISMKNLLNREFDRDEILFRIVESIQVQIKLLQENKFELLHRNYELQLFKKDKVCMYEENEIKFLGKINGVSNQGLLIIEKENQVIKEYNFKEVKFL
ncbi:MAG: biotin--[acetyl-CoA-carboxylase] ligase [Flavobacteriaceae bacterium]|nr:biotin--[acetyl-CoA-carboxylase] ligase [Flavobacteriaceae bacterium]